MSDTTADGLTHFKIRPRGGAVRFEGRFPSMRFAVEAALAADADLSDADLSDADLRCANLSRANLRSANLSGANLSDADLIGADLRGADLRCANLSRANLRSANLRSANLSGANLSDADLSRANLRSANLSGADLIGADLIGADLLGADLRCANLSRANLRSANLSGANLSDANLRGAPTVPNLDAAILAAISEGGALQMADWHACGTTHCRAGWAIHLAGDAGYALEKTHGSAAAGALIYAASRPGKPIPNFYCSNEAATRSIEADALDAATITQSTGATHV